MASQISAARLHTYECFWLAVRPDVGNVIQGSGGCRKVGWSREGKGNMSKMTEKDRRRRDAKRNIGEELLRAVREMKAGKAARVHRMAAVRRGESPSDDRRPQA